jgi:hypothetical protein
MGWLLIGAIFVIGWALAFIGIIYIAGDLWQEVREPDRGLPVQDSNNALDLLSDAEQT